MGNKQILFTIVIVLSVTAGLLFYSGDNKTGDVSLTPATEYFIEQIQGRVVSEKGQPIEGFEPFMFVEVYPGLVESDFDGVETFGDTHGSKYATSADDSITPKGMGRLLENVAKRAGFALETKKDIDMVLRFMEGK